MVWFRIGSLSQLIFSGYLNYKQFLNHTKVHIYQRKNYYVKG